MNRYRRIIMPLPMRPTLARGFSSPETRADLIHAISTGRAA